MATYLLPQIAQQVLQALTALEPAPQSVWLFGSRANGRVTPKSDTDLLVFASQAFLEVLRSAMPTKPEDVDILVVIDGETIAYPWKRETGSLCVYFRNCGVHEQARKSGGASGSW